MPVLLDHIKKEADKGKSLDQIRRTLLENNFPESSVDSAMLEYKRLYTPEEVKESFFSKIFKRKPKPKNTDIHDWVDGMVKKGHKPDELKMEMVKTGYTQEEADDIVDIKKKPKPPPQKKAKINPPPRPRRVSIKIPVKIGIPKIDPKIKEAVKRGFHFSRVYVLAAVIIAVVAVIFFASREIVTSPVLDMESVECSRASLVLDSAIWNGNELEIIITNNGLVDLRGFEAFPLDGELQFIESELSNPSSTIRSGTSRRFDLSMASCSDVDRLTFRSLQCPENAIHTVRRSKIVGC